jgi:hypothetical protein
MYLAMRRRRGDDEDIKQCERYVMSYSGVASPWVPEQSWEPCRPIGFRRLIVEFRIL